MEHKKAALIDLTLWERSGGGGNGWSYTNRNDSSIMLKLNKEDIPEEVTYREFAVSKTLHKMGIKCPEAYDFVTDGTRFGMTFERIRGKKSYVRMIAENPALLEPLAKDFARRSKEFHSIECDTDVFESKVEICRSLFAECPKIPSDVKEILNGCLNSMDDVPLPVHGDFTPGNIIRSEDGTDYWIDLGEFSYGDPDIDMGSLVFIAECTPAKVVESLFHLTKKQWGKFVAVYGREYYGDKWKSAELERKIHDVIMIKAGMAIVHNPRSALLYLPFLRGKKLLFSTLIGISNVLIRKYN